MISPELYNSLQSKYHAERDKRLGYQKDGLAQFIPINKFEDINRDSWIDYDAVSKERPLQDGSEVRVLITGGGHAGLLMAVRLIQAGFNSKDIIIVDKAGGFGGTWYWNRYPGLMCDVEGYCYLPLLDETGFVPKHRYSYGHEIRNNAEKIAEKWDIQGHFGTEVTSKKWNEETGRWDISLLQSNKSGTTVQLQVAAQFVILTAGVFPIPNIPRMEGFNEMRLNVKVVHSARWDYALTGGSQEQPNMTKLEGKTIAIIGSGATAVQLVPELAKWAKHLYVFQRTPTFVGSRNQKETTPDDWKKIAYKEGWQRERMINFDANVCFEDTKIDLVSDGWSSNTTFYGLTGSSCRPPVENIEDHTKELCSLDFEFGEKHRAHIARQIHSQDTALKLQPWYYGWCKRPAFHDDYLPTFNRDNVTLVNLDGKPINKCTPHGLHANGADYNIDFLVLATGFVSSGSAGPSAGVNGSIPIIGRGERSLEENWQTADFGTMHGITSHGFPNLFFYSGKGGPASPNMTSCFNTVAKHVANILRKSMERVKDPTKLIIEISKEAQEEWGDEIAKRAGWFAPVQLCTPGYFTDHGEAFKKVTDEQARAKARGTPYGGGPNGYRDVVEHFHQTGELAGVNVVEHKG